MTKCRLCEKDTSIDGTKRCNRCWELWELERRIKADPLIEDKIIEPMEKQN